MAVVGLEEVEKYFLFPQNTIAQYIATRPILDLCLVAERRPGARVTQHRWGQGGLDLYLGGCRMMEREMEASVDDGTETDVEEQRLEVE